MEETTLERILLPCVSIVVRFKNSSYRKQKSFLLFELFLKWLTHAKYKNRAEVNLMNSNNLTRRGKNNTHNMALREAAKKIIQAAKRGRKSKTMKDGEGSIY